MIYSELSWRDDVVVETASLIPRDEDRGGGPVAAFHHAIDYGYGPEFAGRGVERWMLGEV
jgi:hypothetical protein